VKSWSVQVWLWLQEKLLLISYIDIPQVVRETIQEIGYTDRKLGFDADSCAVLTSIDEQSPDIAPRS